MERAFQSKRLGDSSVRLIVPAYHADKEDVYVFKTRHHPRLQLDWKESAVNVALATAAAPTYFQAHPMPSGAPLIDGGIWANKPVAQCSNWMDSPNNGEGFAVEKLGRWSEKSRTKCFG